MLSALGLGSKSPSEAAISKLINLSKDSRGWQEVIALILRTLQPDEQLRARDRRIIEIVVALSEAQLSPYPNVNQATADLLSVFARLLATRGLHAHLPKHELGFLCQAAHESQLARASAELSTAHTSLLLGAIISVIEACASLPRPTASTEDEKLERAARSHLDSCGCLGTLFEALSAAVNVSGVKAYDGLPLDGSIAASALRVLHSMLVARPERTEYTATLSLLQHAVAHCDAREYFRIRTCAPCCSLPTSVCSNLDSGSPLAMPPPRALDSRVRLRGASDRPT